MPKPNKRPTDVIGNAVHVCKIAVGDIEDIEPEEVKSVPNTEFGHPCLKEHLEAVMALMRASPNWNAFKRNLTRAYPKHEEPVPLALGDDG